MVLERFTITTRIHSPIFIATTFIINVYVTELVSHLKKYFYLLVILKHQPVFDIMRHCWPVFEFNLIFFVWEDGDFKNCGRGGQCIDDLIFVPWDNIYVIGPAPSFCTLLAWGDLFDIFL